MSKYPPFYTAIINRVTEGLSQGGKRR